MWRFLNNITRVFRTHVYNPRPSAGVLVDEDQEHDHTGQGYCSVSEHGKNKNLPLNRDEHWNSEDDASRHRGDNSNINGGNSSESRKTFQQGFWHLLHGSHKMFQAATLSPVFIWSYGRENFKRKPACSLLYHIFFASPGGFSSSVRSVLPTIKEEHLDQGQHQPFQLAIKDAAGAAIDKKINTSESETLEKAMTDFKKVCHEYSACSESLLGLQAANAGDMPTAVEHLRRSCLLGNMSACFNLGLCYETGSGVPQDETKAVYFYQKAAKGGHKMALYNLGLICLRHEEEDKKQAIAKGDAKEKTGQKGGNLVLSKEMGLDFLEEAAGLGLPEAQTYLGLYLMDECQPTEAVAYFKAAANQSDNEAQYLLAVCYEQGLGVETNECLAARFYSLAAQTGHNLALYNLGVFNEEGLGGLPKNKATAVEMYRKAAKLGSVEAEERLGEILGPDETDSTNTELMSNHDDDENKEGENFKLMVYGQPEEQREAETRETSLAFGSTAAKDNFISILSPSSSFPSLRSLSSLSLPKQDVKPTYLSSSHIKFMRHDNGDSSRIATHQANGFLERVNFFLGMAPTAMTLDHDLDISPHSIPLSSLVASEEGAGRTVSSLHRSHTFSDFSMIAI